MKVSYAKAEHEFFMQAARARANELRDEAVRDCVDGVLNLGPRVVRVAHRFLQSFANSRKLRRLPSIG